MTKERDAVTEAMRKAGANIVYLSEQTHNDHEHTLVQGLSR